MAENEMKTIKTNKPPYIAIGAYSQAKMCVNAFIDYCCQMFPLDPEAGRCWTND